MKKSDFVHLHLHTEYSLLDGACRIKKMFSHIAELGQTAAAITDHGNMYGVTEFCREAKKYGIKPIVGCEIYVAARTRFDREPNIDSTSSHLVLLCKNDMGYRNLIKIVSAAHLEGFYFKPRADIELIRKHSEGLICLSACTAGEIPRKLLNGDYAGAKETAENYRNIFGEDFFIEVQNHGTDDELRLLPLLYRLSAETGIPLAATNDCHYISASDSEMQKVMLCIQINKSIYEPNGMGFEKNEFYIKSTEEMYELFRNHEEAVLNTSRIAEKCNFDFEFTGIKLPEFKMENVSDNKTFFKNLCRNGMYEKYGESPSEEIVKRLEHELDVIIKMGYTDYYLIVWDFIRYARENDIPVGPGRGSGAGSLCAYCIGITGIDPIRYNLLFERFLNPERLNMPDFDIDFCIEGRQRVKDYVIRRYGEDKVSEIISFDTLKARAAVRDVGRVMNLPYQLCDYTAKLIGNHDTLSEALENEKELAELYKSDVSVHKLIDIAMSIEGMPRHATTHAAGVVISAVPLSDLVPLRKNDGTVVTQYTMTELDKLGLLKMDFLGLRNLTVIRDTVDKIKKFRPDFDISKIPEDDAEVYKMMSSGNLGGVFQFESQGMRNVVKKLEPHSIEDLTAVISLYRPGPMDSIPVYIKNHHNPENIKYKHPMLEDILKNTYGCIIYQEQVMEICRKMAGFSYGHADAVRYAMGKKKHDEMLKERSNFISGAVENRVSQDIAESIFDEMERFASYAFNKSHAAAYASLAYQTAYLKCHYFREYMSSLMSSVMSNTSKLMEYTELCRSEGVPIKKPDINISTEGFSVLENGISFGLLAVKNVGKGMIEKIVCEREQHGKYVSFQDFCERVTGREINKRAVENLIKAGAFDNLDLNRRQLLENYENIMDSVSEGMSSVIEGQMNFLDSTESVKHKIYVKPSEEYDYQTLLKMEKEAAGFYLSGNPLDEYDYIRCYFKTMKISELAEKKDSFKEGDKVKILCSVQSFKPYTTKSGSKICFITAEDETGTAEMVAFSDIYAISSQKIRNDEVILIMGKISLKDKKIKIICDSIFSKNDFRNIISGMKLCIKMKSDELDSFDKIESILKKSSGDNMVCIYLTDRNKMISPKNQIYVTADEKLYRCLAEYIEPDKIGLIK